MPGPRKGSNAMTSADKVKKAVIDAVIFTVWGIMAYYATVKAAKYLVG